MPNQFTELAEQVAKLTEKELADKIAGVTKLTSSDVSELIHNSGISKEDLAEVLEKVHDASLSNEKKAEAIRNTAKGIEVLISIAKKFTM